MEDIIVYHDSINLVLLFIIRKYIYQICRVYVGLVNVFKRKLILKEFFLIEEFSNYFIRSHGPKRRYAAN